MPLLEIVDLVSGYGEVQVLREVSLDLQEGQLVSLLGANGTGKTTLARAAAGLLKVWSGQIRFDGSDISRLSTHARAALGVIMVPEGRELFAGMTVQENLEMGGTNTKRARARYDENIERIHALFPILDTRRRQRAGTMSGGEQQMLAIARGLISNPRLLIVDELSLGLAPKLVGQLFGVLNDLRDQGQTMLLTEQNVHRALEVSDHAYVLAGGEVMLSGPADEVRGRDEVRRAYLGM